MQDIRKPYSRSKSNRTIDARVLAFEKKQYGDESKSGTKVDAKKSTPPFSKAIPPQTTQGIQSPRPQVTRFQDRDINIYPSRNSGIKPPQKSRMFETMLFVGGFGIIILVVVLYTFVFNSATVTITPKFSDIAVNKSMIFDIEGKGDVGFVLATTTLEKKRELTRSEEKKVQSKAEGKIVIFNKLDAEPQRLIKNTRFESSDGKIFRIADSVTVPGKKGNVPGSIEVTVLADSYGEDYNIQPSDFTIPGFKGTPRYDGFFARSSTSMKGGSSGNVKGVSASDISAAKDELALSLTNDLKAELKTRTKEGYIPLVNSIAVTFDDNEKVVSKGETNTYNVKATGYLVFAKEEDLAKAIEKTESPSQYKDEPLRLDHQESITFSLRDTTNISKDARFDVLVAGTTRVVWQVTNKDLKNALISKDKGDFSKVMNGFGAIKVAEMDISPAWSSTFPKTESKINIVEKLPVLSK